MKYKYFQINTLSSEPDSEKLNAFISAHAVSSIMESFVDDGQNSFWSVRVVVTENKNQSTDPTPQKKRSSVDYREIVGRIADYVTDSTTQKTDKNTSQNLGIIYTSPLSQGSLQQGQNRVLHGGSWINNGHILRSAVRNHNIGFRLAGALLAGGSINQRAYLFRSRLIFLLEQIQGLRSVRNAHGITSSTGAGFLFVFKVWQQAHSKLRNCCHNAEDGQKDKRVVDVISCTFLSRQPAQSLPIDRLFL